MTFTSYLTSVLRNWILVVVVTVLGAGLGVAMALQQETRYEFTSSYVIAPQSENVEESNDLTAAVRSLEQGIIPHTLALVLGEDQLAESARGVLNGERVSAYGVDAYAVPNTNAVRVVVSGPNPDAARAFALEIGTVGTAQFTALYPSYVVQDLTATDVSASKQSRSPMVFGLFGAVAGFVLGVLLGLLVDAVRSVRRDRRGPGGDTPPTGNGHRPEVTIDLVSESLTAPARH